MFVKKLFPGDIVLFPPSDWKTRLRAIANGSSLYGFAGILIGVFGKQVFIADTHDDNILKVHRYNLKDVYERCLVRRVSLELKNINDAIYNYKSEKIPLKYFLGAYIYCLFKIKYFHKYFLKLRNNKPVTDILWQISNGSIDLEKRYNTTEISILDIRKTKQFKTINNPYQRGMKCSE